MNAPVNNYYVFYPNGHRMTLTKPMNPSHLPLNTLVYSDVTNKWGKIIKAPVTQHKDVRMHMIGTIAIEAVPKDIRLMVHLITQS